MVQREFIDIFNILGHKYYLGIGEALPVKMLRNVYDHKSLSTTCIFVLGCQETVQRSQASAFICHLNVFKWLIGYYIIYIRLFQGGFGAQESQSVSFKGHRLFWGGF